MTTNAGAEAYSVHKAVMRVPESYYVRAVIRCTQINCSLHVVLAVDANTAAVK